MPQALKQYAEDHGLAVEWKDVLELIAARDKKKTEQRVIPEPGKQSLKSWRVLLDRPVYGPPMRPCALAYCPTNEQGVVYLFGSVATEMGFMVTHLQAAFPDCEAMRRTEGDKWQPVKLEFEQKSRNFLMHGHDVKGCDLIVCWEHNWPECPLEVLELRTIVATLAAGKPESLPPFNTDNTDQGKPKPGPKATAKTIAKAKKQRRKAKAKA